MPSHFPNSPELVKGALLGLLPNVISFQPNPDTLTRCLRQVVVRGVK
jgi:hypothetical protein